MAVPERVVDLLEAVEVEHQQGEAAIDRRGALDLVLEPAQQLAAVGDAGEVVVERLVVARLGVPAQLARGARDDREEHQVEEQEPGDQDRVEPRESFSICAAIGA